MVILSIIVSATLCILALAGPLSVLPFQFGGVLYLSVLLAQLGVLCLEFRRSHGITGRIRPYVRYEVLATLFLLLFIFSWIYARNANMDYAQRTAATTSVLSFEQNTKTARYYALIRYLPLLAIAVYWYIRHSQETHVFLRSAMVWIGAGVVFIMLALPSAFHAQGIGIFAWIASFSVFFILRRCSYARGLWLIGVYAAFSTMCIHYWLGGFSLVSLQGADFIIVAYYLVFFVGGYFLLRRFPHPVFWAALWTIFSFYRHYGFSAFPWGLLAHTQYRNLPFIQIAELTGIWGIEFALVYWNLGLAVVLERILGITRAPIEQLSIIPGYMQRMRSWATWKPLLVPAVVACLLFAYGIIRTSVEPPGTESVRIALVQNNTDPRRNIYSETFKILKRETSATLSQNPDMVVWPETAFVPNIRRWKEEDPKQNSMAKVVNQFLDYQSVTKTYLLTGNDDYVRDVDAQGNETARRNRNAAVLFSDTGERRETYHKIRLVPFTEYFPYKKLFPRLYNYLLQFDTTFWEPGSEALVFEHPDFLFGVMICFEDSFPASARPLVLGGAEVLVNLSNDFWAQDPVEAQQHLATAVFRSVEHRRPFVRATTSGITAFIDDRGAVVSKLDPYTIGHLVDDVTLPAEGSLSVYTRFGNWFVYVLMGVVLGFIVHSVSSKQRYSRKKNGE